MKRILSEINEENSSKKRTLSPEIRIIKAVEEGDVALLAELAQKVDDLDAIRNEDGLALVHIAAKNGSKEVFQFLIDQNVNAAAIFERVGSTAIHFAAQSGNLDMVNYLISAGLDVHAKCYDGITTLHFAVQSGNPQLCVFLRQEQGLDPESQSDRGLSPLDMSNRKGDLEIFRSLRDPHTSPIELDLTFIVEKGYANLISKAVEYCKEHSLAYENTLHMAIEHNQLASMIKLVNSKFSVNLTNVAGETPLYLAAKLGNHKATNYLINKGADINIFPQNQDNLIHLAAKNGWLDLVQHLLTKGLSIEYYNGAFETPLYVAAKFGKKEVVDFLIQKGANIFISPQNQDNLLHPAVKNGWLDLVQHLLTKGLSIEYHNGAFETPLYVAAKFGKKEVVDFLIQKEANIFISPRNQDNLLHLAVKNGWLDLVQHLLTKGLSIEYYNRSFETPLYVAAKFGHKEIVDCLIQKGANIIIFPQNQDNLLHLAVKNGWIDLVQHLLTKGFNIEYHNGAGETPLYVAAKFGHKEVMEELLRAGAGVNMPTFISFKSNLFSELVKKGDVNFSKYLLSIGGRFSLESENLLKTAVRDSDAPTANFLLSCDSKISTLADEISLIRLLHKDKPEQVINIIIGELAQKYCYGDMVILNYLIDNNISIYIQDGQVNEIHGTLLCQILASQSLSRKEFTSIEIVKALVERYGESVNNTGGAFLNENNLHHGEMSVEVAEYLIEQGADIEAVGGQYETPLGTAILSWNLELVKCLVKHGADVNFLSTYVGGAGQTTPVERMMMTEGFHGEEKNVCLIPHFLLLNGVLVNEEESRKLVNYATAQRAGHLKHRDLYNSNVYEELLNCADKLSASSSLAFAIYNICRLSNDMLEVIKPDGALITNVELVHMIKSIMSNYLVINKIDDTYEEEIKALCEKNGALSEMLLECFEESKLLAASKIFKGIVSLKPEINASALKLLESDQLLAIAKDEVKNYLLKNGLVDGYEDEFYARIISISPKLEVNEISEYINTLKQDQLDLIDVIEGELLHCMYSISPMSYTQLITCEIENEMLQRSIEFYNQNSDYKIPYMALTSAVNTSIQEICGNPNVDNIPYINYLMLNDKTWFNNITLMLNTIILPQELTVKLKKAVCDHQWNMNNSALINSLQEQFPNIALAEETGNSIALEPDYDDGPNLMGDDGQ